MPRYTTRQREALLDYLSRHPGSAAHGPGDRRRCGTGRREPERGIPEPCRTGSRRLIRRESRPGSREAVVQYVGAENCRGHLHLTCTRCGRTVHLSSAAASLLTGMAAGEGFSLDLTRTALYGLCPRCRQEVQP